MYLNFEGSISDKQIVQRSGFLDILDKKVMVGEIKKGDAIMADKGFDIQNDLKKLGLQPNIPPFLKKMMLLKPKQLQGTAYMWKELFARLEGSEYFIQSFSSFYVGMYKSIMDSGLPIVKFPKPRPCMT